jgi:hypothetical protein
VGEVLTPILELVPLPASQQEPKHVLEHGPVLVSLEVLSGGLEQIHELALQKEPQRVLRSDQ